MLRKVQVFVGAAVLSLGLGLASHGDQHRPARDVESNSPADGFPLSGIVPKDETGALEFLEAHPDYDGRGTIVAIFDTGCDAAALGLTTTPQGEAKFIDFIDATGSGDVDTSQKVTVDEGKLTGLTGRELTVSGEWTNPSGEYRLGMAAAYDLFPHDDLVGRLKEERQRDWEIQQRERAAELEQQIDAAAGDSKPTKEELEARLEVLESLNDSYDDPGPVYDCVVWNDGNLWRVAVDTDEDGDLTEETVLTDYDKEPGYATFSDMSRLNFTVHVYDDGDTLSLVVPSGDHGTHVAGIVGAYEAERPQRNGIAPGCRMVSVKIGDTRLGGMETGAGLVRGIKAVLDHKCDLVNMSYGEPSTVDDRGRIPQLLNELVREHGVIFVSSAGNAGPALSTMGSPGGTGSAIIGVGAYISPEMMDVEYTAREKREGTAYTWTSRGPTYDGDWGADIFAPGGAITSVPPYTMQSLRQMNGTSMASPNACGNIALLLSAMKQQEIGYTNWSVLRAIQNTAEFIPGADRFAQGPGLLQVGRAHEYLTQWHAAAGEQLEIQLAVASRGNARGIYLREPAETDRTFESIVNVTPHFPGASNNDEKLNYELELRWSTDVEWVGVGEHMVLLSGGNRLPVRVDPTGLEEGVHTAEVVAHDANHPERGPLARLPVTVIKGASPHKNKVRWEIVSDGGDVVRKFIHVPEGATWGELKIRRRDEDAPKLGFLHCIELIPGLSFEGGETLEFVRVEPKSETVVNVPVTGGRTLEVCWGHYWSSQGAADLEFTMTFRGLSTRENSIALPADGSAVRVDVRASVARETLGPGASLTKSRRILAPTSASDAEPLPGERDALWDVQRTHRRVLTYKFSQASRGDVTLHCPELEGFLYDAPVDHFLMTLSNADGRKLFSEDIYAEGGGPADFPYALDAGEYTVELELRHLEADALDRWSDVTIAVDQNLSSPIRIPHYSGGVAAAGTPMPMLASTMLPGDETTLWFRFPDGASVPGGLGPGDMLIGSLHLTDEAPETPHGGDTFALTYTIPAKGNVSGAGNSGAAGDYEQAYLDFLLEQIAARKWQTDRETIDKLSEEYRAKKPDDRKLAVARLHVIDNDDNEDHLPDVVAAADAVIAMIDPQQLQSHLGIRHDPQTDEDKKTHEMRTKEKEDLIDALYRKGRALAHMELPEIVAEHPIADQAAHDQAFDETFRELQKWVDTTDAKYALLHLRRNWRLGDYGKALKMLNEKFSGTASRQMHDEKRLELFELLEWPEWQEYQRRWNLRRYGTEEE